MRVREYGTSGLPVLVLHGGPGAPGYVAPVARRLAEWYRVLEPFQRGSGGARLTVARHVSDLHEIVETRCRGTRPALVGHSWGAMLALAYAAAHPGRAVAVALVGCGTFDQASRDQVQRTIERRLDEELRRRLRRLPADYPDPNERLAAWANLLLPVYSENPIVHELDVEACDARAHEESWDDMVRCQAEGVYPAAFAAIREPVIMLHGADDPHPGRMIRASLARWLPQLEYHEWARCGHYPWIEAAVGDDFIAVLHGWIDRTTRLEQPSS